MSNVILIVTAKFCSDLSLLSIDHHHFFLQHQAAVFILASGSKRVDQVILYLIYILNLTPMLICALYFI